MHCFTAVWRVPVLTKTHALHSSHSSAGHSAGADQIVSIGEDRAEEALRGGRRSLHEQNRRLCILGMPVSVVTMHLAIEQIDNWIRNKESRYVCVADVHSLMLARSDQSHNAAMQGADLIVPDGMPLVWTSHLRGETSMSRVPGPDMIQEVCAHSVGQGWRHYFLGGAEGVPERLAEVLSEKNPGLRVSGTYAPPFKPLTEAENAELVESIIAAKPDIIWVGLGCPKQERWMTEHVGHIPGAVLIGVGAAFDFHVGRIRRAPPWMRNYGLEWLHRLLSEPRRLWKRYLLTAPAFVVLASRETLSLRHRSARLR